MIRRTAAVLAAALAAASPAAVSAQEAAPAPEVRLQAISILPVHAIFGFYAGDYERVIGPTTTLGFGAAYFSWDDGFSGDGYSGPDLRYASAEAKLRYYPSADPLNGLSFGVTFGPTYVSERASTGFHPGANRHQRERFGALGFGFEVARSHILGVDRRFHYGYGGGAKRLIRVSGEGGDDAVVLPTLRFSVGYAF
jgi:hypothetical protein